MQSTIMTGPGFGGGVRNPILPDFLQGVPQYSGLQMGGAPGSSGLAEPKFGLSSTGIGQAAIDAMTAQRDAGNGPVQQQGGGGSGMPISSNQGGYSLTGGGTQYGSTQGRNSFTTPMYTTGSNGGGTGGDLLASLTGQASSNQANRMAEYKNLIASIMGPSGFLSNLGKSGERRIAENTTQERGRAEQDLTSRGLGNTTIRENMLAGVSKNAEAAKQDLAEKVATQKAGTSMQLFGMNPSPGIDTYLNLLMRLGQAGK